MGAEIYLYCCHWGQASHLSPWAYCTCLPPLWTGYLFLLPLLALCVCVSTYQPIKKNKEFHQSFGSFMTIPMPLSHRCYYSTRWFQKTGKKKGPGKIPNRTGREQNRLGPSKRRAGGFPGGPVVKNPPGKVGDVGSIPCWGTKVPHAMEKLSLFTTTTEAHVLLSWCTATRVCVPHWKIPHEAMKILCAAAKTQYSQNKLKKKKKRERERGPAMSVANLAHITRRITLKTKEEKVPHHLWSRRCSEYCVSCGHSTLMKAMEPQHV